MDIRKAITTDITTIMKYDQWIDVKELTSKIHLTQVYILHEKETFIGWMRYNLFWDNTPFMTMLHFLPPYQGKGYGTKMVTLWESEMRKLGYLCVMTSTSVTESAQYFYEKIGYTKIGGFALEKEPLELLYSKSL